MTYKLLANDGETGNASGWVRNLETGEPVALYNDGDDGGGYSDDQSDYDTYKSWLDAGNTPSPAD